MTREEAMKPLGSGEARFPCSAGALLRGQVRNAAIMYGVDYYEEKGWLESTFILRGDAFRVIKLQRALKAQLGDD